MDPEYCENVENLCYECQSTLKVQSHCKHCHVNICKNCVEKNRSEGNKKHEIISIDEVCPTLHLTKCETHHQQYCIRDSKNCYKIISCSCIETERHSGHQIDEVENIVKVLSSHSQDSASGSQNVVDKMIIKTEQHRGHHVEEFVKELNIAEIGDGSTLLESTKCETHKQKLKVSSCIRMQQHSGHQDEDVENFVEDLFKHQDEYVPDILDLFSENQVEDVENIVEDLSKHQNEDVENIVEDLSKFQVEDVENIVEDLSKHLDEDVENIVEDLSKHLDEDVESIVDILSQHQVEDVKGLSKNPQYSKNVENICHECQSTLKVQSRCKICRLYCVEYHISNDDKVHEIVSIDEVCSSLNLTKCRTHNQKICTLECKECHQLVCSLCIRSGHHRGHQVEDVAHIVKVLSTYIVGTNPPSETTDDLDKMITWSKHITSEKLKDVFNSFQVGFPDDPLNESFVHKILNENLLTELKIEINSLSKGIMLIKNINREHLVKPGEVLVFEIDVINEGDQLAVIQKDNCSQKFFYLNEENIARIILIRSESIPVIEAKLAVYRNYKHLINKRKIWLQHEYEEFDEVAKLIAYERLSSICISVESLINVFTIGLYRINSEPIGTQSTTEDIKTICNKTFYTAKDEAIGLVNYNIFQKGEWGDLIAQFIHEKLYVNREPEIADVLKEIKKICRKTVDDLNNILRDLEDFLLKLQPEDQSKLIEEWFKREVIQAGPALQKYPSVIQFIAGHTKDGQTVVKVYLRNDDKNAESFFKNSSKVLKDTKFEFVYVEKNSKAILKEVEKITHHEKRAPAIDRSTLAELGNIIQEEGIKIYAQYSNVIGIGISQVRCVGDMIKNEPCIVLYCLDKTIIPFGEKPLPEMIAGWPCDTREDFVMFGKCPRPCPSTSMNFPESGCSIGIPSVDSAGSVGFLVESKNSTKTLGSGFLTASHVAIERFEDLYHQKSLLSMNHLLSLKEHHIVHPSWKDSGNIDFKIGKVVESFIGNYGSKHTGLDFALVKNCMCRKEAEKETLPVANDLDLTFGGTMKVIKTGRTTGKTIGNLLNNILSVRVSTPNGNFAFFNCYAIGNTNLKDIFFEEGDSGSGVFVIESDGTLKPLWIAFAYLNSQTAVCRIDEIVNKLDLEIVKYGTSRH